MFHSFICTEPKKRSKKKKNTNAHTYKCKNCKLWFINRTGICPRCGQDKNVPQ